MAKSKLNILNHDNQVQYITPTWIYKNLGEFDLDPACPVRGNPKIAKTWYTEADLQGGGLKRKFVGRVWLNPPYGRGIEKWMKKLAQHGNGTALTFARTCAQWFHDWVFEQATGIFFFKGRVTFLDLDGVPMKFNSGAPSVLIVYGENNYQAIEGSGLEGKLVKLNPGAKHDGSPRTDQD